MIIKQATQLGNPIIRTKSKSVASPTSKKVKQIVKNLIDSMHYHKLVGMAAPQIGVGLRIFVSEIMETQLRKGQDIKNADGLRIYINPRIIWKSKELVVGYEGCGSVADKGLFGAVKRPKKVIVQAQDENDNTFELKADNLLARVIQHEYDHIEGVVFTDKADPQTLMSSNEFRKNRPS